MIPVTGSITVSTKDSNKGGAEHDAAKTEEGEALPESGSHGYDKLAGDIMGPFPQLAIFRRFSSLNMLNLLTLQAELIDLSTQLHFATQHDVQTWGPEYLSSVVDMLMEEHQGKKSPRRLRVLRLITQKLDDYSMCNTALLKAAKVAALPRPSPHYLKMLQDQLNFAPMNADGLTTLLSGNESNAWFDDEKDLVTVNQTVEEDMLTQFLNNRVLRLYHHYLGSKRESHKGPLVAYSSNGLTRLSTFVATVFAAVLPVCAVIALYWVDETRTRIFTMLGMTAAFAIAVSALTTAKHQDVMAATAAFAAVEVIFIGSVDSNAHTKKASDATGGNSTATSTSIMMMTAFETVTSTVMTTASVLLQATSSTVGTALSTDTAQTAGAHKHLSSGSLAGVVIGSVFGAAALVGVGSWFLLQRRKPRRTPIGSSVRESPS